MILAYDDQPIVEIVMSTADTCVRTRIDTATKERAAEAPGAMGRSISDAGLVLIHRKPDADILRLDRLGPHGELFG